MGNLRGGNMLSIGELELLNKDGWILKNINLKEKSDLLKISKLLGEAVPSRINGDLIDKLSPIEINDANPNSLSALNGTGNFPFHTDMAYQKKPARYIILYVANPGPGNRPTLLIDGYKLIDNLKAYFDLNGVFKVKNGKKSFLCNFFEKDEETGVYRIRMDQGCMTPVTRHSILLFKRIWELIDKEKPHTIVWEQGDLLIFDNWRMLHGRGSSNIPDSNRTLYRINII